MDPQRNIKIVTGDELLRQTEANLAIWECLLALGIIYIGFMALALLGLKISSRRV